MQIDDPPPGAEKLLRQVNGNILPFYVYTTPDGQFISGTSGYRDEREFKGDLERVLRHDALKVPPEVEKRLAAAVEQARKDLDAKQYGAVVKAWRDGVSAKGFSDSKRILQGILEKAVAAGRARLAEADALAQAGKHDEAKALLKQLQSDFRGTDLDGPIQASLAAVEKAKPSPGPDTVVLKDGTSVNGKIVARTDDRIVVQTPDGKFLKIEKDKVAEIRSVPK